MVDREQMQNRLMVALDVADAASALHIRDTLLGQVGWLKVGLRLFVAEGPALVQRLAEHHHVFLDLKFHDIPNTVAQAVESAGLLGVQMMNVHAAGGMEMLKRAAEAANAFPNMKIIGVTVLTSSDLSKDEAASLVIERAKQVQEAGLDGVVCSVHEAAAVKQACGDNFLTVTPGIRWGGQDLQDQKRVADPGYAIRMGSDYLVIGRPIIAADNRKMAAQEAVSMMCQAVQSV